VTGAGGTAAEAPFAGANLPLCFTAPDAAADDGVRLVLLDRSRVLVTRRRAGASVRLEVPVGAYRGVVARVAATPSEDGRERLQVVMVHADPELDILLHDAACDGEAVAAWRGWSQALGLPLLFERADGSEIAVGHRDGEVSMKEPLPRRHRVNRARLRPRFLLRRRMGQPLALPAHQLPWQ
jgi:hypothetical protein